MNRRPEDADSDRGRPTRRRVLTAGGLAAVGAVAGCLGSTGGSGGGQSSGTDSGGGGASLGDHASTAGLDSQPYLGPAPGEGQGTIVAYEDPSCPRCATFEEEVVPKIRSKLTDPGKATFVFRGFPVVYPWGEPASKALEATLARDEGAHWALVDHYFAYQDTFETDNVLEKTASFLDSETDVDGSAVVEAVDGGDADPAVQTDLDAGKDAGASSTPTIYMFKDGRFRTESAGSISYETIESVLQV